MDTIETSYMGCCKFDTCLLDSSGSLNSAPCDQFMSCWYITRPAIRGYVKIPNATRVVVRMKIRLSTRIKIRRVVYLI